MRKTRRFLALAVGLALVGAACGSSDGGSSSPTTGAATTAAATTAAPAATTAASTATTAASSGATTTAAAAAGEQANTKKIADLEIAAQAKPLKAAGEEIIIGMQNPEGDPAGTFPEYSISAEAAVKYINEELGGIGGDPATGKPGRPIKLEVCKMAITPADSQKCANELAAKKPFAVLSSLNFFGNHFAIYKASNIPVVVGTPVTALDFTSPGVFAIGNGGGCLGTHTGLVQFITGDLGKKKIGVPWADTPPGVFCYHDLEKKPLEVLAGKTLKGTDIKADGNANKGKIPDLQHIGVAIKPGQADVTPQATQVLDFKPDGIIYSAQGADCWTFVNSLAKLGWKAETTPIALSTACLDIAKMKEIGPAITKGIYFVGAAPLANPEALSGQRKIESQKYVEKMTQYATNGKDVLGKGFAGAGFSSIMNIWMIATLAANGNPATLTQDTFVKTFTSTDNHHMWGGTGLDCAKAAKLAPYTAVCNSLVAAQQWDGEKLVSVKKDFTGLSLVGGTELDFGK